MFQIDLQSMPAIDGWEDYYSDGEAYLKTAIGAHARRREVFTTEILYNLVVMAIEKFIMAALMRHGTLPYNHTMADLVEAMEQTFPEVMGELQDPILALDRYQQICDLDGYTIQPPAMEEIPAMLELAADLRDLVQLELLESG